MADVKIVLDTKILDRIVANSDEIRDAAVRKAAFAIEGNAKRQVQIVGAIDTGSLRNSIYTTFSDRRTDMPDVPNEKAPRAELPKPSAGSDQRVAYIGPSVEYGIYVEMGTRFMAARPYLAPAVANVQKQLIAEFRRLQNGK